ncbi:acyl-CoA synthetase [Rhodoferax sp. GW822-FHT02A01]|uniref:LpxL/LpxP family acyltransferase n=1 Tax=Rhodoferax sp. GW822-FHT02A01 TaxID=3141537 RepID=UPI00315D340D
MSKAGQNPEWMLRKERGSVFWLHAMAQLSLRLGRRLTRLLVFCIALYFLLAAPAARRASRDYLTRCLQRRPGWIDVYRHFLAFASTIHDRVYFLNGSTNLFDIRTHGAEAVKVLHHGQQGLLLFGSHLGSFEVLHTLAREESGMRVCLAMYPENARMINSALRAINPSLVQEIIALGHARSILLMHQRLQEGAMVGILADRATGASDYEEVMFLGTQASFPLGPFRMAAMLRQPLYFMAGLYQGANRYDVHFEKLSDFSDTTNAGREVLARELMHAYVAVLERHCRAAPYNWFNFYDFWKPDSRAEN